MIYMITTKIEVPPHLKEYLIGKFCNMQDSPIHFPDKTDIYHIIYDLLERRPINIPPIDQGNLEIYLPERSTGKNPKLFLLEKSTGCCGQKYMISWTSRNTATELHTLMEYIIS